MLERRGIPCEIRVRMPLSSQDVHHHRFIRRRNLGRRIAAWLAAFGLTVHLAVAVGHMNPEQRPAPAERGTAHHASPAGPAEHPGSGGDGTPSDRPHTRPPCLTCQTQTLPLAALAPPPTAPERKRAAKGKRRA